MFDSALARFRAISLVEGTSFLVLLLVGMPLKYMAGMPTPNMIIGWVHGLLFILYLVMLGFVSADRQWPLKRSALALIAAVVPLGPFVFDRSLREELEADETGAEVGARG